MYGSEIHSELKTVDLQYALSLISFISRTMNIGQTFHLMQQSFTPLFVLHRSAGYLDHGNSASKFYSKKSPWVAYYPS